MVSPQILSAVSPSYDSVVLTWSNIENETGYIIEKYIEDSFDSIGSTSVDDTVFFDTGLTEQTFYLYQIKGRNALGYSYPSVSKSVETLPIPGPYLGTPRQIPGKIEAENYDYGEAGEAYYDTDITNSGGAYRSDAVDIESCQDDPDGYNVGWIYSGEWLKYSVDVNSSPVNIKFRIASANGGSIKLELNGAEITQTSIHVTGGWQTWETLTIPNVELETGMDKKLKVTFLNSGFNLNWISFVDPELDAIVNSNTEEIQVFPNPATDNFQIVNMQDKISGIEIRSITGVIVKYSQFSNTSQIDISDLNNGLYIVKVNFENQGSRNFKIMKI
jgi:hypothetical protein